MALIRQSKAYKKRKLAERENKHDLQKRIDFLEDRVKRLERWNGDGKLRSVCLAYEQGYGKGLSGKAIENPYGNSDRDVYDAWDIGYREGEEKKEYD